MKTYDATDMVLAVARSMLFVREEPKDSNAGQAVEAFLQATGLGKGYPWCAAFVAYCGRAALGTAWPLPMTAGCAALGAFASQRAILDVVGLPGDVFLVWSPKLGRYAHTGFIVDVAATGAYRTIEGNTNDGGSRDGWGAFVRQRSLGLHDRVIRWTRLIG